MLFVRPDFYDAFHCLAGACRHSCCIGWEIDVDEDSLRRYRQIPGEIGKRLRENIVLEPAPHFLLGADERCPFLREDRLCSLILTLGEDSLCDICASHPRFYNEFPDRLEAGLGLCCEEAARLLTAGRHHLRLLCEGEAEASASPVLRLRETVFSLLADESRPLTKRMEASLGALRTPLKAFDAGETARFFLTLERMDEAWTSLLEALAAGDPPVLEPRLSSLRYARIAEYLVYRHFASGPQASAPLRLQFCFHAVRLICALEPLSGDALRLFSAEIEYSDENIDRICSWLNGRQ